MDVMPIFASLRKHRIPTLLIVMEIALACAVLCNAVFMISRRIGDIHLPNAVAEQEITVVTLQGTNPKLVASDIPRNLAALRTIAGVQAAAIASTMPLSHKNWGWSFGLTQNTSVTDQKNTNVTLYFLGEGAEKTLGLQLREGRFFNATEYADSTVGNAALPTTHVVIVNETVAKQLWPDQSPLGKTIYSAPNYYTVVGVIADVLRPFVSTQNEQKSYYATFYPMAPDPALGYYLLRSAPADRDRILKEAVQKLQQLNPAAVATGVTYESMRGNYFANTNSMVWTLTLVCLVMLAVTAFGIVGLTSFWVGQRRRQIGIRRAVGATRGDILRYFRTENFLLSTAGVVIGMGLAFAINLYLMQHYELSRMPWYYLPVGAVTLWLLGQLAVMGPAMRAAAVPPVVATHSA